MSIASRTPEGEPNRCPICGCEFLLEPSRPPGDAPCPTCGHLVWWFEQHSRVSLTLDDVLKRPMVNSLGADSLDVVELVMELEEEFDIEIPEVDAEKLHTLADVIAYIQKLRRRRNEAAGD